MVISYEQYINALLVGLIKNIWLLSLLIFPLLVDILPVKSPRTLTIIARNEQLVILVVAGHGGFCQIFGI